MMTVKLGALTCAVASLACAASFQSHYIQLGTRDTSVAIEADAAGNLFIVSDILDAAHNSSIRVTKTDPNGNVLGVLNFGQGVTPYGAAIDFQGNLLVAGNGLVAKVDNALANVLATSSIGGSAVTTDASGNVYVAGGQSNPPQAAGYALVAELSPDLSTVAATTLFGSPVADCNQLSDTCRQAGLTVTTVPTSIAIDPSGAVVLAGYTNGTPAPLSVAPYYYGFVAKFSADLSSLLSQAVFNPVGGEATYFRAMALDAQGNILLAGNANNIGTLPGGTLQPDTSLNGGGMLLKFDGSLNYLWGTYFGATGNQGVQGVAVDPQGNLWITGVSQQNQLPDAASTSNAILPFVAELTPDGSTVLDVVSSQFGGTAVTVAPSGGIAVLGATDSFLLTGPADQPALLMVASSANNQSSGTIAPAELISLYGTGIGPDTAFGGVVANGAFTNSLGGYQVLFNGVPAPLLYAGPNQMNVVSPTAIAGQQTADIEVVGPLKTTAFPTVFVAPARPQIFSTQQSFAVPFTTAMQTATFAVAYNQDGTLNSTSNPAPAGSIVTIWATGTGLGDDPLPDGAITASAATVNLPIVAPTASAVLYAGQAPGAVQGLTQVNVQVPSNALGVGRPFQYPMYFEMGGCATAIAVVEVSTN